VVEVGAELWPSGLTMQPCCLCHAVDDVEDGEVPTLGLEEQNAGGSGVPARSAGGGGLGSMDVLISSVAAGGVMHFHRQLCRTNADYVAFRLTDMKCVFGC
jgi:hypothetical protein